MERGEDGTLLFYLFLFLSHDERNGARREGGWGEGEGERGGIRERETEADRELTLNN